MDAHILQERSSNLAKPAGLTHARSGAVSSCKRLCQHVLMIFVLKALYEQGRRGAAIEDLRLAVQHAPAGDRVIITDKLQEMLKDGESEADQASHDTFSNLTAPTTRVSEVLQSLGSGHSCSDCTVDWTKAALSYK